MHNFDRKRNFYRFSFHGHYFSPLENIPKFWDKILCLSFNKGYENIKKKHLNTNIIVKKIKQYPLPCNIKKYTKASENQNLIDYYRWLWNSFCWWKLIPNNKELSLFPKIYCFRKNCCIDNLLQWSSLWIFKRIQGFGKKYIFEFRITDSALNRP